MLAYRADEVPVGEDQREHLELMRDVAAALQRALRRGRLVVPEHAHPDGRRADHGPAGARRARCRRRAAPSRAPSTCSTSPTTIEKKFKRAVTDSGSESSARPDKPGVTNLIEILGGRARGRRPEQIEADLADARGYGDLKTAVAEAVVEYLAPVRERYEELRADEAALEAILRPAPRRPARSPPRRSPTCERRWASGPVARTSARPVRAPAAV